MRWIQNEDNFWVSYQKYAHYELNSICLILQFHYICLENALKALTVDVIEQLQKAAQKLGSDDASEDDKLEALETILDYTDDIDTAIDFCKIGGIFLLLPSLSSSYTKVRAKAASLVGELSQNNPYCQKELLQAEVLPKLVDLLNDTETATNGIHAISCLVRSYEPSLAAFIEIGGLECLLGCLQKIDQEKLIVRSLFLLNSLCVDFPAVRNELVKLKAVDHVTAVLEPKEEYDVRLETTLSVLCLLTENTDALERCRSADLNLRQTIDDIIKLAGNKPECRETVEYAQALKEKVFSTNIEATDR